MMTAPQECGSSYPRLQFFQQKLPSHIDIDIDIDIDMDIDIDIYFT